MNTINHNLYADTYLYNVIAAKSFENAFPPYKDFTVILSKSFYDFLVNDGNEFNHSCIAKFHKFPATGAFHHNLRHNPHSLITR